MASHAPRTIWEQCQKATAWAGPIGIAVWLAITVELPVGFAGQPPEEGLVAVVTQQGDKILAEVADTTEKRARGLMFRESLAKDRGMLFTFPEPQQWTFWMKNTRIALDIIWMDGKKKIVHVERNVPGCNRTDDGCTQYQPNDDAVYVLEVAAGVADALKLQRGAKLQFQVSPPPLH